MDFFERIGEKLTKTGKSVVQGTKNYTEINKLKNQITEKEQQISQAFCALGQIYYQEHKDLSLSEDPKYRNIIADINNLNAEIERNKAEIERIKEMKPCPNCGAELEEGAKFCNNCGLRIEQVQAGNGLMNQQAQSYAQTQAKGPQPLTQPDYPQSHSQAYPDPRPEQVPGSEGREGLKPTPKPEPKITEQSELAEVSPAQEPEGDPVPEVCPECSASLTPGDAFCTNCGEKIRK